MRGTAVTDTFGRTVSSGWGTADTGQAWSTFGAGGTVNASDWNVSGGFGTQSVPAVNAYRLSYLATINEPDVDLAITVKTNVATVTGGQLEIANLAARGTSTSSYYLFRARIETSGSLTALIYAPGGAQIGSITVPNLTYTGTSQLIRVRAQAIGKTFRMKVWDTAGSEPAAWPLTVVDSTSTAAGWIGVRSGVASGNTNTLPVVFSYDNFSSALINNFPSDPLPLTVLAAFGANLSTDPSTWPWQNITADVRAGTVSITQGRADETSQASPAACRFELNNGSAAYSAYNPASPNYPNVKRNTPIWVIVDPATRFFGYADGFPPVWNTTGKVAVVSVSASGILRRLTQGKKPIKSAMYQAMLGASIQPSAYWPMEDGSDGLRVSQGANVIAGGAPMVGNGSSNFAATAGAPGSDKQPTFSAGGNLSGNLPSASGITQWRIQCLAKFNTINTGDFAVPLEWNTADGTGWELLAHAVADGGLGYSDTNVHSFSSNAKIDDGLWHELRATAQQSGGNILLNVYLDGAQVISQSFAGTLTAITQVFSNRGGSVTNVIAGVGHFIPWNGTISIPGLDTVDAMRGHVGEVATARLTRLCNEQGVPITITGTSTATMGPQTVDTFVNLLRECESADLGLLYDGFGPGLGYITRAARYNLPAALTLDMAAGQVDEPFNPADDDQRIRNKYAVTRKGGATATYEDKISPLGTDPQLGIGVYDASLSVSVAGDDVLPNIASWLVHLGTTFGFRYPNLNLDFAANPGLIANFVAAPLNSRFDVLNVSSVATNHLPETVSLLEEGYTATLAPFSWKVGANCSLYQPHRVFILDTDRLDAVVGSSTLASGVPAGATSLSVATSAGNPLWTTRAGDFASPIDIDVGGWHVIATNITGSSSPQTFTIQPAPAALATGAAVKLWRPAVLAL